MKTDQTISQKQQELNEQLQQSEKLMQLLDKEQQQFNLMLDTADEDADV